MKLSLEQIQDSDNIDALLTEKESDDIGFRVCSDFDVDKQSRAPWEKKMKEANELALQITQEKSYPWKNAANVKFPLLTIAALQFASRAYPALIKAPNVVKYRAQGSDDGQKSSRAMRIGAHMSYQLLNEDEQWEEDQDKAFLALPILGCVFKKSYHDPVKEHNCSSLVLPKNLVVHYYAKNLEDCERKTEIFQMYDRKIKERQLRGVFSEKELGLAQQEEARDEDKRQGTSPPVNETDRPRTLLEQHRYLDLDGDGYKEPYVVTVDKSSKKVLRIVARFKKVDTEQAVKIKAIQERMKALAEGIEQEPEQLTPEVMAQVKRVENTLNEMEAEVKKLASETPKVLSIEPVEYYTKYPFIPSPDGGFYDLGFGALLSPLNDSVNTLINQLLDSGTLQNSNSGFIGRGARIKGGRLRFDINEWKRVDVSGGTLRDNLVPLPANQPSAVLFNLLSLLISYTERVASVNDAMMGENPGQNTPAFTSNQMLEQGLQVFNGIFKRVYRAFRSEIRKLYDLNSIYLDQQKYFEFQDKALEVVRADYGGDSKDLVPAADPNAFSNAEKMQKAQIVSERSMTAPGYDRMQTEKRLLTSLDIPDIDEVFPLVPEVDQDGEETGNLTYKFPPQPDPEMEIKKADMQRRTLEGQSRAETAARLAESKVLVDQATVVKMMADVDIDKESAEFKKLELLLQEQEGIRNAIVELAKIDNAETKNRVDGKSGND